MACPDATAPINLVESEGSKCILQCAFSFSYSPLTIHQVFNMEGNEGQTGASGPGITMTIAVGKERQDNWVKFGDAKYDLVNMTLKTPGLHHFDGKAPAAELQLVHQVSSDQPSSVGRGATLIIAIPIAVSNVDFSDILEAIVNGAATTVPRGNTVGSGADIGTIDPNRLVPVSPFFTYQGTNLYTCTANNRYIVIPPDHGLHISANSLDRFRSYVELNKTPLSKASPHYSYNPVGAGISGNDETYMECAPTGSSDDKTMITHPASKTPKSKYFAKLSNFVNDDLKPALIALTGAILLLSLIKAFEWFIYQLSKPGKGSAQTVPSKVVV